MEQLLANQTAGLRVLTLDNESQTAAEAVPLVGQSAGAARVLTSVTHER